ncbi:Uu.00g073110.m01.CDS01 [Anthostomella pinea]|uniref:Uu.00g073110.m01.CDS01 n=1 Tax=Anthostomella pinea TaxID=933095 RepID=A0AAI8VV88_9PEZI|nr:Uu.00g073110.m01.CDS01 [Anthostomella pinea]
MATTYKRSGELPFTRRAWNFVLGQKDTKVTSANGDHVVNGTPPRAAKRRRIDSDPEAGPRGAFARLLPENPSDFEKVLKIQVLRISHRDACGSNRSNPDDGSTEQKDIPIIPARCKIMIFRHNPPTEKRILHCDSQTCNVKVFRDDDDICRSARVYLPTPFIVPAEKLYVWRYDDDVFTFLDHYSITAELESAGDPSWPPFELFPKMERRTFDYPPHHWALASHINYRLSEKGHILNPVNIRKQPGKEEELDMMLRVCFEWSTNHTTASTARAGEAFISTDRKVPLANGALEPLTNGHVNGRVEQPTNGHPKDNNDGLVDEDEDHGDANTPSRSLRTREKQNYNLKLLSDKARGKERKERKQRKLTNAANAANETGQVTWILPRTGHVPLKEYQCIRCYAAHSSMAQLVRHVEAHREYKFTFDMNGFRIWITLHGQETPRQSKSAVRDLSSPEGHETDEDHEVSPQKLPRTLVQHEPTKPLRMPSFQRPKDTRQRIPIIKQPIYDRLSKSLLEPGSLVDPPKVDDTWLVQKHRDIIRDYSDVHQDEKEYISKWDAFVNKECVTSEPHLQEVYIRFVQTKASWLVASQSRMTEWSKHLGYLKTRSALTEPTILEALAIVRRARSERRPDQPEAPKASPPRAGYRKSVSGCAVCGQPVRGPSTLICSNLDCDRPLYHVGCIKEDATEPVDSRKWRCNVCHK